MLIKGLKILATLAILLLGAMVINYHFTRTDNTLIDPYSLYDDSTQVILQINRPAIINKTTYSSELSAVLDLFFGDSTLCSTFLTAKLANKVEKIFVSTDRQVNTTITLYFGNPDKSGIAMKSLLEMVNNNLTATTEKYLGNTIYQFPCSNTVVYCVESSGIILISETVETIKKILRQSLQTTTDNATLTKLTDVLKLSSRQSDANLFINLEPQSPNQLPYYSDKGWCVLDLWLKNNAILLNGLSPTTIASGIISEIQNSPSIESTLQTIVPIDTRRFFLWALPSGKLNNKPLSPEFIQQFIGTFGINPKELIQRIYGGEIMNFTHQHEATTVALKITGESVTNYLFESMITKASQEGFNARKTVYSFDSRTTIPIFEADWNDLTGRIFGKPFSIDGIRYAFVINNTLFFTETQEIATTIIQQQIHNQTLIRSEQYLPFKLNQATTSNVYIFDNNQLFDFWLTPNINQKLTTKLNNIPIQILWQISTDIDRPYHNIVVSFSEKSSDTIQNFIWKSRLNSGVAKKPLIIQSQNLKETAIVLQDSGGTIYFINDRGRTVWQKQFEAPIMGNINRVDLDKTGNFILLFSTTQQIIGLMPDGSFYRGFPIDLPTKATCPVAVFDYENDYNYRLAIALENRGVAIFDLTGNPVSGWEFKKTDGVVTTAPQHFKIGNKDYILLGDTLRIYILDRRGNERIKPKVLMGKSAFNPFYYSSSRNRWFTTTPSGDLMSIDHNGVVKTEKITTLSPQHFYLYADFLADRKGSHIFVDQQRLVVANSIGKKIIDTIFTGQISEFPSIYQFSSKQYGLGIVDKIDQRLYLFASDGRQLFNFPMHGTTPFSIYRDQRTEEFKMIAGKADGYVYNIKIK